jgi:hypothetical protein
VAAGAVRLLPQIFLRDGGLGEGIKTSSPPVYGAPVLHQFRVLDRVCIHGDWAMTAQNSAPCDAKVIGDDTGLTPP